MLSYYNDNDPHICAWLRELIAAGGLSQGTVDERSILDIRPEDCGATSHFFAGIGGWPYALRLAGWPSDHPVWTASLPCQPWSAAGKSGGVGDDRHLWPAFHALVAECRPPVIFGEQVEAAVGLGWLDGIFADLEALGYACGAAILPAAGVGAPHIRSRIFWVAQSGWEQERRAAESGEAQSGRASSEPGGCSSLFGVADAQRTEQPRLQSEAGRSLFDSTDERLELIEGDGWEQGRGAGARRESGGMGNADKPGPQGHGNAGERASKRSPWATSEVIYCRDGKWRRIPLEPAFQPLADGVSAGRVGILRGAGNAIVPQVAAEFIKAYLDS